MKKLVKYLAYIVVIVLLLVVAIYTYLQSLEPFENEVERFVPAR